MRCMFAREKTNGVSSMRARMDVRWLLKAIGEKGTPQVSRVPHVPREN